MFEKNDFDEYFDQNVGRRDNSFYFVIAFMSNVQSRFANNSFW